MFSGVDVGFRREGVRCLACSAKNAMMVGFEFGRRRPIGCFLGILRVSRSERVREEAISFEKEIFGSR